MSRGKYLSLEEARRLGKMDQRVALRCGILSSFPYKSLTKAVLSPACQDLAVAVRLLCHFHACGALSGSTLGSADAQV